MKNLFLFFIILCLSFPLSAQDKLLSVPEEMRSKPWLDREEHIIWNHSVTMIFGEKVKKYRHMNVGEFTSLAYQDIGEIIEALKTSAAVESWTKEHLDERIEFYSENAPGGRLFVFLSRYEQKNANTKWYFIIIRDENDEKILEKDLEYQAPETPEGIGWWNYYEFLIDEKTDLPFYVYLNYKLSDHLSDFKFLVKSVGN